MKNQGSHNDIGCLIKIIDKKIIKEINKNLVKFNLTATQEKVLWIIYYGQKKGDVFQKDIERELDLSNPTVTGIVKRLEEKDFLNSVNESNINIAPYEAVSISYLISVFANLLRLDAFIQIQNTENEEE